MGGMDDEAPPGGRRGTAETKQGEAGGAPALAARLREAGGEELAALVRDPALELGSAEALQALANPHAGREVVEALAARRHLLTSYEVRKAVAFHPAAPEVLARRFLGGLYWRDLLAAGSDPRVRPTLRRAADRLLGDRLTGLSLGEKINMARRAGPGLVQRLRQDPSPRVMRALLENPRLTEGSLLPVLNRDSTPPPVLEVVAADRRWGVRYPIRAALARNPSTPMQAALRILPHLKKPDQRAVARDLRIQAPVRRRARLLLGEG